MYRSKEIKLKIVEAILAELPTRPLAFTQDLTNEERDFLSKFINDGDLKYV